MVLTVAGSTQVTTPLLLVIIIVLFAPGLISTVVAPNTVLVPDTLIVAFGLLTELLPVIAIGTCVLHTTLPDPSVVIIVLPLPGVISTVVAPRTVFVPVTVTVDLGLVTDELPFTTVLASTHVGVVPTLCNS
ncbi:hypothetical protein D3C72_1240480 [compost metagenome]